MKTIKSIFLLISFLSTLNLVAQAESHLIYKININGNIGSNSLIYLKNGMHDALNKNADCVLIHMNTYGGAVKEADSMRTSILNYPLPVYVFIDNNAASAGALIAIACDSIFMRSSASIGAATVVNGDDGMKAPDKYQSYMRGIMRATAESHGKDTIFNNNEFTTEWKRNPIIAEAMVSEHVVIPGYVDSTQILTLTANQALELGYCDGIVENINEISVKHLGFSNYDVFVYNPSVYDKVKGFLMNSMLQVILIMLIIGGIYFELQSPGIGFPTAIALTAAILYFTPLYLTGYAQNWEVLVFVLGLILVVFEIFVIPGFGFVGISGIVMIIGSLVLSQIGNIHFDFSNISGKELFRATMIVVAGFGCGLVLIIYFSNKIGKPGLFKNIALGADQEGYFSVPMEPVSLVGHEGVAATVLRPSGKVLLDDKYYDAISMSDFIEKGEAVIVRKYENFQLYVVRK